ncbi:MAG: OsmC family protein [Calditrichaeota bacterium]|nr:OsmC family protein [Calditrichota bacterium]
MKAYIKQIKGLALAAKSDSEHWITMDGPYDLNGQNAGPRPMEVFLMSLGACTAMDVLSILKKMRQPVEDFEMEIDADRAPEHPKVFTRVNIKYIIYGRGIKPENVERAIELSQVRYCSASEMVRKTAEITTSFEIREPIPD